MVCFSRANATVDIITCKLLYYRDTYIFSLFFYLIAAAPVPTPNVTNKFSANKYPFVSKGSVLDFLSALGPIPKSTQTENCGTALFLVAGQKMYIVFYFPLTGQCSTKTLAQINSCSLFAFIKFTFVWSYPKKRYSLCFYIPYLLSAIYNLKTSEFLYNLTILVFHKYILYC